MRVWNKSVKENKQIRTKKSGSSHFGIDEWVVAIAWQSMCRWSKIHFAEDNYTHVICQCRRVSLWRLQRNEWVLRILNDEDA